MVALLHLQALALCKRLGINRPTPEVLDLLRTVCRPSQSPTLQQGCRYGEVIARLLRAILQASDAVTRIESAVPKGRDKLANGFLLLDIGFSRLREQDEQVDVGVGGEFTSAIPSDGQQSDGGQALARPEGQDDLVDVSRKPC
jgi:hypothetical protein